ncbi:ATP-binding cassette domain-containing protein, partial [Acinetobacter baumannii]
MSKLVIQGVSRQFPGVRGAEPTRALEPVTLAVADNDFITILGPSGCGKSTLLRILAGFDRQSTGSTALGGRDLLGMPPKHRDIAMVFQNFALY